jgi:hypothetical protein
VSEPARSPSGSSTPMVDFEIVDASHRKHAATPTMVFACRVVEESGVPVYTIALTCQLNIDPARRRYDDQARERLVELFGEPQRWGATTHSFMWTKQSVLVPSFTTESSFEIAAACTYDLEVAAAKYFYSVTDGQIPLTFLMSGSILYREEGGALKIVQVPWNKQARFSLPVETWREMIDHHYPNGSWITLHNDTVDALQRYKAAHGLPSFDDAVAQLLRGQGQA